MTVLDDIFRLVVDASWRSSCLVLVVLALRPLLHRHIAARILFWVWLAVAVRLLLPFTVPAAWSPFNLPPFAHRENPGVHPQRGTAPLGPVVPSTDSPVGAQPSAIPAGWFFLRTQPTPGQWAALVWAAGVVTLLLARLRAYGRFARTLRRSPAAPDAATAGLLAEAVNQTGGRSPEIVLTNTVSAPALHGIFRPRLLFPPGLLAQLHPSEIQMIFAHELAHDRRRDLLAHALIRLAVFMHWFNPLVWIVARIARHDGELACDEFVTRRLTATDRELYGATLLKIVSLSSYIAPPPLALGVAESKQQIKRRIQMIAANRSSTRTGAILSCALLASLTAVSLTEQIRAQQPAALAAPGLVPTAQPATTADPLADNLDARFANGIVAVVGGKAITVEDVRREVTPFAHQLQSQSKSPEDLRQKLNSLRNSVIKDLIGKRLLITEFRAPAEGEAPKQIPDTYVENEIARIQREQFDNDRSKFLSYLQARGQTTSDFRRDVEEDIIYHYMVDQEKKQRGNPNARMVEAVSLNPEIHLRMIQLSRSPDETDAALLERADPILARFKQGESFESLAKEFGEDKHRARGGDWGWQKASDLRPEYSKQLFALKKGEVSAPIVMQEGCFLLYAEDRR